MRNRRKTIVIPGSGVGASASPRLLTSFAALSVTCALVLAGCSSSPSDTKEETTSPAPETSSEETSSDASALRSDMSDADLEKFIGDMSLEDKAGQLIWTHVYGQSGDDAAHGEDNQEMYGVDTPADAIAEVPLGGVLYFAWSENTENPQQIAGLSHDLQQAASTHGAKIPLAITIDQEGGRVARITEGVTAFPGNMPLGATDSTDLARQQGKILGEELRELGINVDFAPVVDVNTNEKNPVIGVRSFGADPQLVSRLGAEFISGMQEFIGASAKHFPGHGDTEVDSHLGLPSVTYDRETLATHLKPFRAAIDAGVDIVMSAHVVIEAIDPDLPSTLSPKILTGLLRDEMGFDGVISTDAIDMDALAENFSHEEIVVKSLEAGADVLLNSKHPRQTLHDILDAVSQGKISEERIDESVMRILKFKRDRGIFDWDSAIVSDADLTSDEHQARAEKHAKVARDIARQSLTVLWNKDVLPRKDVVGDTFFLTGMDEDALKVVDGQLREKGVKTIVHPLNSEGPTDEEIAGLPQAASGANVAVVLTNNARDTAQVDVVKKLADAGGMAVIVLGTGLPYEAADLGAADAYIAAYSNLPVSMTAAGDLLTGAFGPTGKLPVPVGSGDSGFELGHGETYGQP